MQHRGAISGWTGRDGWISPGGVKYRAPHGANKYHLHNEKTNLLIVCLK